MKLAQRLLRWTSQHKCVWTENWRAPLTQMVFVILCCYSKKNSVFKRLVIYDFARQGENEKHCFRCVTILPFPIQTINLYATLYGLLSFSVHVYIQNSNLAKRIHIAHQVRYVIALILIHGLYNINNNNIYSILLLFIQVVSHIYFASPISMSCLVRWMCII